MKLTVDTGKSREAAYVVLAGVATCQPCSACLAVRLSKKETAVHYIDFMALRITPLQNPEIKDAVKLSVRDCEVCLICLILNKVSLSPRSSVYGVYHAPGQSHSGQHHPLLVPARPAQWSHPGLRATVLWKGITLSSSRPSLIHINTSSISFSPYPPT